MNYPSTIQRFPMNQKPIKSHGQRKPPFTPRLLKFETPHYIGGPTGEETADEAKARVEADRTAKVQGQIDRANTEASGVPW